MVMSPYECNISERSRQTIYNQPKGSSHLACLEYDIWKFYVMCMLAYRRRRCRRRQLFRPVCYLGPVFRKMVNTNQV